MTAEEIVRQEVLAIEQYIYNHEYLHGFLTVEKLIKLIFDWFAALASHNDLIKTRQYSRLPAIRMPPEDMDVIGEHIRKMAEVVYRNNQGVPDYGAAIYEAVTCYDRVKIDPQNDIVLTPPYVADLMAELANIQDRSLVCDPCMGCGSLLIAAKRAAAIKEIKCWICGAEINPLIYNLAVWSLGKNGIDYTHVYNGDALEVLKEVPDVVLVDPPYDAKDKGLVFALPFLKKMSAGKCVVLIQENAGAGQGMGTAREILKVATLKASIHMPLNLFSRTSSVQTAIYVFQAGRPHLKKDIVRFVDFSVDGYRRTACIKANNNLVDDGTAVARYAEMVQIAHGRTEDGIYYTKENGLLIEDTITLNGNDWAYAQHKKVNQMPAEEDFVRTAREFLTQRVPPNERRGEEGYLTLKIDDLRMYFPKSYSITEMETTIVRLLEQWQKKRVRDQERSR